MVKCASCSSEVSEGSRFCPSCGGALGDVFATRTVAVSTPRVTARTTPISHDPRTAPRLRSSSSRGAGQGRFAPGDLIAGRYRIVALLGKGGMGEVYRADDLTLEQPVALKFLPEAIAQNEEALSRFRNEVRIARQVSHPNVCRMYDLGEVDGQCFLSMEYVDGEDLGSLLRRIGRLPTDKAIEISRKLCAGLAAAHEKGVLHRDLKPSNVMLDGRGQVLLTDFGLAGLAGEIEGAEVRNGTPAYMAPEQLAGEEVSVRSDIYSLGLVLYEIFTGKLPFESDTLAGLMRAQKDSTPISPSTLVVDLDPMVERVILRCLQAKPALRPPSALAVAAALPGADPLAAALAAGETPSPEMVAAAGEGEGLSVRVAVPLFLAILAAIVITCVLTKRSSALERLRPAYPPEVLALKARETIQRLGSADLQPADEEYDFDWDSGAIDYLKKNTKPAPQWNQIFQQEPALLRFWYRQSPEPLTGTEFHDDLLTPGIVTWDSPAPTQSGMLDLVLDSKGQLLYFERMPDQLQKPATTAAPAVDWSTPFAAAGLDMAQFQPAEPLWTSLAASDTRMAWTTAQPRPRRVEAAALRGRLVYFSLIEPWRKPDRQSQAPSGSDEVVVTILAVILVVVCFGAAVLARKNLAQKRGDRRGAFRLAAFSGCVQVALWLTRGHFAASMGTFGMFILAMCSSVFYGAVLWTIYIALEPYVRRRWPQTLISWSSVLIGRLRDPIVGRDVLIGVALGVSLPFINQLMNLWLQRQPGWSPHLDTTAVLTGLRSTLGVCLMTVPHGIRETLFFFFLIFLLRVLLRNQWLAAAAFALLFSSLNFVGGDHPLLEGTVSFVLLGAFAFVMLRWGLLAMAVGITVSGLIGAIPVTAHASAWYFGSSLFVLAGVVALSAWAFRISIGGQRLWREDLFS